jgi:lipopolysaccharide heptosyltransferase I
MKLLVIRYSAIGDCVMAAHVPSRVRRTLPNAHIAWAVESRCADVVDRETLCNAVYPIPRDTWRKARWSPNTWRANLAYYSGLRKHRFDVGLDLQGHLKTAICLRLAKPKRRLAMKATDALAKRLNPVMPQPPQRVHCVEEALMCLSHVLESDAPSHPIMPKLEQERLHIRQLLPEGKPWVSIAVSAGQLDKAYPMERWEIVAERLVAQDFVVAWLGGPESSAPMMAGTVDLVGKLSLAQSMAVIDESALVLAGDTGAGHLAAAYETPVVSVFGPTDPAIFRPYGERTRVIRNGLATENTEPDEVVDAAMDMLERYGRAISH